MPEIGADAIRTRYTGAVAASYEAQRSAAPIWTAENVAVETWLGRIGAGARVLDIPVGTGRFLGAYQRHGMRAVGMDISPDMLAQARLKLPDAYLQVGDILDIPLAARAVDAAVAVRILNWLTPGEVRRALGQLARVARSWIITGGGHSDERSALARNVPGFAVADEALIESDARRGDYSLVLLEKR